MLLSQNELLTCNSKPANVLISSFSCLYLHSKNDLYTLYIIKVHFLEDFREYDVHAHVHVSFHDGDDANGHGHGHGHDHDHDNDDGDGDDRGHDDGGDDRGHDDGDDRARVNDHDRDDDVRANFPKEMTKPFLHQNHSKKLISYQKSFFQFTNSSYTFFDSQNRQ